MRPDFREITKKYKNIYFEIGAGKGRHAIDFSKTYTGSYLFAVERTKTKYAAFKKTSQNNQLENLAIINADAIAWSVYALPPSSLSGVFILYPNPEPNNPNQRWHNMPYFEFLVSRVKAKGSIVLASNIEGYINEARSMFKNIWRLPYDLQQIDASSQRTHFEKKYLQRGEKCWQLDITKPNNYVTQFDDVNLAS